MKVNISLLFFFVFLQITSIASAATVYKWVDSDGSVHYESKPQHKNAKKIKLKDRYINSENAPAPASKEESADEKEKKTNASDLKNKSVAEVKKQQQEQKELKMSRCHAAKAQLQRAINSKALYDLEDKGNRILLHKKQYEQAMTQAKARVKKWCQ
ncbi:MAG TPA: DUF4124 domain-containing protein [Gammaproteobacteria bacterium]|nr:DUF4124 domain-containing protein [Gammaproteobacteria bacterium]